MDGQGVGLDRLSLALGAPQVILIGATGDVWPDRSELREMWLAIGECVGRMSAESALRCAADVEMVGQTDGMSKASGALIASGKTDGGEGLPVLCVGWEDMRGSRENARTCPLRDGALARGRCPSVVMDMTCVMRACKGIEARRGFSGDSDKRAAALHKAFAETIGYEWFGASTIVKILAAWPVFSKRPAYDASAVAWVAYTARAGGD